MDTSIKLCPLQTYQQSVEQRVKTLPFELGTGFCIADYEDSILDNEKFIAITVIATAAILSFGLLIAGLASLSLGLMITSAVFLGIGLLAVECWVWLDEQFDLEHQSSKQEATNIASQLSFQHLTRWLYKHGITREDVIKYKLLGPNVPVRTYAVFDVMCAINDQFHENYRQASDCERLRYNFSKLNEEMESYYKILADDDDKLIPYEPTDCSQLPPPYSPPTHTHVPTAPIVPTGELISFD